MIHGDVSADLLRTIFSPRTPLHDGAVIIRGETILRGRGAPAAGRDDRPVGALRDASPGRPRRDRGHRRGRRRGVRGERPDQPRRAVAHRAQPQRGPAGPLAAEPARPDPRSPARGASGWDPAVTVPRRRPHGRRGDPTPRDHRPQLAPQARSGRSRDPAVRRPRPVAGHDHARQRVDPGRSRGTSPRNPRPRSSSTPSTRSRRSATSRRRAGARSPRRSRPRSTCPTCRPEPGPVSVPVQVRSIDPRDQRRQLHAGPGDRRPRHRVRAGCGRRWRSRFEPPPPGLDDRRRSTIEPETVTVSGPKSQVDTVVAVRADVVIQPSGISVDQDVPVVPVDAEGQPVAPVEPRSADRARHDPGLPGPAQQEPAGQPRRDRGRRLLASRSSA